MQIPKDLGFANQNLQAYNNEHLSPLMSSYFLKLSPSRVLIETRSRQFKPPSLNYFLHVERFLGIYLSALSQIDVNLLICLKGLKT